MSPRCAPAFGLEMDKMPYKTNLLLTLVLLTAIAAPLSAQDKKNWIKPAEANKLLHFQIQGEYLAEVEDNGEQVRLGAQVIALSDKTFRSELFIGGLPGAGWSRGQEQRSNNGKVDGDFQVWTSDDGGEPARTRLVDGNLELIDDAGNVQAVFKKVHRKSPTLNAKPPKGALVLFNGSAASAKNFERGQLVLGNLLRHDCESKEKFGDHQLHLEFRTPYMPFARGQGRGNSGMYLQGRYEVQVLDSFGLEGKNNECGGIYSISEPIVNMCLPPLSWQTYDVDFTAARYDATSGKKIKNARATIKHNGVVIHNNLELPKGTPGKHPEANSPGILYLQGHGNPVVYRNVWVLKK